MASKYKIHDTCQIDKDILSDIYDKYFGFKSDGTFVEIGSYDGIIYSNTYGLAINGWKGLFIEADPSSAKACEENYKNYPNIKVYTCVVGDYVGECKLYKSSLNGDSVSSTLLEDFNIQWGLNKNNYIETKMDILDNILEKQDWPSTYDLLVIDVEEAELQVLSKYSIDRWTPKIAIIEINERHDQKSIEKSQQIYSYFTSKNYHAIHRDHINTIFCRR